MDNKIIIFSIIIYSMTIFFFYLGRVEAADRAHPIPHDVLHDRSWVEQEYMRPIIRNLSLDFMADVNNKWKIIQRYLDMYRGSYRYEVGMLAATMKLKFQYMLKVYKNLTLNIQSGFEPYDMNMKPDITSYLEVLGTMMSSYNQITLKRHTLFVILKKYNHKGLRDGELYTPTTTSSATRKKFIIAHTSKVPQGEIIKSDNVTPLWKGRQRKKLLRFSNNFTSSEMRGTHKLDNMNSEYYNN